MSNLVKFEDGPHSSESGGIDLEEANNEKSFEEESQSQENEIEKLSLKLVGSVESPYYLLTDQQRKYPEAPSFHGVSRVDESLEHYETYLKRNVKRLIQKPWKVNIENLLVCMTNDVLNTIRPEDFNDVRIVALDLIDQILVEAVKSVNKKIRQNRNQDLYAVPSLINAKDKQDFYWPQMDHFDVELIKVSIRRYVSLWRLDGGFTFFIRYLSTESKGTSEFHYYQVMFSKVTMTCPNPQTTASVYFTIEVTRVVPQKLPVRVTYQFEGYTQNYLPDGRYKFQQFIINNIMKNKLILFTELDF